MIDQRFLWTLETSAALTKPKHDGFDPRNFAGNVVALKIGIFVHNLAAILVGTNSL